MRKHISAINAKKILKYILNTYPTMEEIDTCLVMDCINNFYKNKKELQNEGKKEKIDPNQSNVYEHIEKSKDILQI